MARKIIVLNYSRSTHGTHVYQEPEVNPLKQVFPTIYVKKGKFPAEPPETIKVTIEIPGVSSVAGWEN
jgi:hypothetical protein